MLASPPYAPTAPRRPRSFAVAATAVGVVVVGLGLWIVEIITDVTRLDAEARRIDLPAGPPLSYSVVSIGVMAALFFLILVNTVAMSWLWIQGQRLSHALTLSVLAATILCCGLPSALAAIVLGTARASGALDLSSYADALAALHAASTPLWARVASAVASGFVTLGSFVGAVALLKSSARRFVRQRMGQPSAFTAR